MISNLLRVLIVLFVLTIVFLIIGGKVMPDGPFKVLNRLEKAGIDYQKIEVSYQDSGKVNAITFGSKFSKPLLLIHGSPGDWSAWEKIIANDSIRNDYFIIAIDRAGYGETTVPPQATLEEQSKVVWSVINHLNLNKKIIMVGHSYGGAVVEQLLVENDTMFSQAILAASTSSPVLMEPRWYNKMANWQWVKNILSPDLNSSNIEMMVLPKSLSKIESNLGSITTPIVFIQGGEDVLVPFETTAYFQEIKPSGVKYILIEDLNHFIPWSDPDLITDVLLNKSQY